MYNEEIGKLLSSALNKKKEFGTYKMERIITSAQSTQIYLQGTDSSVLNFCTNNYLGLSNHPAVKEAAQKAIDQYGFGMASVRFICGTQDIHKELENAIADFLSQEDALLYSSCFDANGGLFENLLAPEDVVISASHNHASIIDGVRLSKAEKKVFDYDDMIDLENKLKESQNNRIRLVVTDGVFSMEGELAPLTAIAQLCRTYQALLVVDDSHATGFIGENGRGSAEHLGVHDQVDIFTGTLGKALGGANGGYIAGRKELIDWFRNTSRPYLFSNSLAPPLVAGARKSLDIIRSSEGAALRKTLHENTIYFRREMSTRGFNITEGIHPIVPIMLGEAKKAMQMAEMLLDKGIYVIGFSYPVVPKDTARIRVQISAEHTQEQLNQVITAFEKVASKLKI